jgi:hypothetical protein
VLASSVAAALFLGLAFYTGFLGRTVELAFSRDLPHLLCFALVGVGYAVAYNIQRHI